MPAKFKCPKNGVAVRMYRQGLGDCFLLAFSGRDEKPRYMLIDCGVLLGTTNANQQMTEVAEDIKQVTGGRIHVLVVTHEHWDHISGFYQAENVFKDIVIEHVWMGWTEDPDNALAKKLRKKKKFYLAALKIAANKIIKQNSHLGMKLDGLLGFYGESVGLAAKKTSDIMTDLAKIGVEDTEYCYPGGEPLQFPDVENIRIFILGPPESQKLIKKSDPSKKNSEVYLTDLDDDQLDSLALGLLRSSNTDLGVEIPSDMIGIDLKPFDDRFRIPINGMEDRDALQFFKKYYQGSGTAWRKIDDDWSSATSELALKLDKHTNNTCLAMAIELVNSGDVLLFPGDAQVGNWLGWHELTWDVSGKEITINDLLEKTVLYKVGHHGSHNATLKEKGLELMTNSHLAAMIPVDEKMAKKKKWKMPYDPLYQQLKESCKGRIIRIDKGLGTKSSGISNSSWNKFKKSVKQNKLYVDFFLKG